MRLLRAALAAVLLLCPAAAFAQAGVPPSTPMSDGSSHASVPSYNWCSNDIGVTWVPCPSPAASPPSAVSRTSYTATGSGTGYAIGDLIDRIVTTNAGTGAVVLAYWVNVTQGTFLSSAPAAANIALKPELIGNWPSVFGASQSGTWSVGVNNFPASFGITGSVAVTGTFWQATQPVSATSLPLPAGAATEATLGNLFKSGQSIGNAGFGANCLVVSGNQSYVVGSQAQCNLTSTGRLKVGISSAGNIDPAAQLATTLEADIVACKYRASPVSWSDLWTGAIRCNATGALVVDGSGVIQPVSQTFGASGVTPVTTTVSNTTPSTSAAFTPLLGRPFVYRITGTWAGSCQVFRNGVALTFIDGSTKGVYTGAVNTPFATETVSGTTYSDTCTLTSGSATRTFEQ